MNNSSDFGIRLAEHHRVQLQRRGVVQTATVVEHIDPTRERGRVRNAARGSRQPQTATVIEDINATRERGRVQNAARGSRHPSLALRVNMPLPRGPGCFSAVFSNRHVTTNGESQPKRTLISVYQCSPYIQFTGFRKKHQCTYPRCSEKLVVSH
jgi:hypothetical protein